MTHQQPGTLRRVTTLRCLRVAGTASAAWAILQLGTFPRPLRCATLCVTPPRRASHRPALRWPRPQVADVVGLVSEERRMLLDAAGRRASFVHEGVWALKFLSSQAREPP